MQPMTALLATDGSSCAQVAIDLARTLPWPAGSVLHVATVVDSTVPAYTGAGIGEAHDPVERQGDLIRVVATDVDRVGESLAAAGVAVQTHVLVGRPASAIADEAETLGVDLIIMGSRGHGQIASMVLGSVSAEVADRAHCAVLVARRRTWARAVLAVDGSTNAERAMNIMRDWPIFSRCSANVVSVADTSLPWTANMALSQYDAAIVYPETERAIMTDHQRWAERASRTLAAAGLDAAAQTPEGDPATELIRIARDSDADVIVLGTRGQTGLPRLISGSVTRNVMLHAQCSVLVVKEAGRYASSDDDRDGQNAQASRSH